MTIDPEDYLEPSCPLEEPGGCRHGHVHGSGPGAEYTHGNGCDCGCGHEHEHDHGSMPHRNQPRRIPMQEVIQECDRLFNSEKMVELGEHLRKWREEARRIGDREAELGILSELMGHYRMTGDRERGLMAVRDGFALLGQVGIAGSVTAGTILINGATALQAFGDIDGALNYYKEAFRCYGAHLDPNDWRFAGLLNNMAAAYAAKHDVKYAEAYYRKALDVLKACGNLMDAAVTHVNLAQMYAAEDRADPRIASELELAVACFDDPAAVHDGYYAHTCRKCASAFGPLGFPEVEEELNWRADEYYAGN
ncbi:MAG: tetratricopeptide repeat protein [Lentisphaeria bacterium]|nr:tetratricopeptide repeat protein [Lentisphaeria bacterium]